MMKNSSKGMFWFFTIILAFVNPVISFILLIMYYLPWLIKEGINEFPIPKFIYPCINAGLSYLKLFNPISKLFSQPYMFYLHPWEFLEKNNLPKSNSYVTKLLSRNTGKKSWIIFEEYIKKANCKWVSCQDWLNKSNT